MLGLRHRHAVARHDDDLGRVLQDESRVIGRAELDRPLLGAAGRARHLAAETAEDDREEVAVHALAHDVGQDRARGADQRAGDDQRRIAEREADAGGRPSRIGIEHRDHHRHVGAADRDDDQDAEQQREPGDGPELVIGLLEIEQDDEGDQRQGKRDIDDVPSGQRDRLAAHAAGQLKEGDHRAGEGDGADGSAERHFDQALLVDVAFAADVEGRRRVEGAGRHQHRRHADQRVEGGDQFRHGRHRHAPRDHRADTAADGDAADNKRPGDGARRRMRAERGGDRDRHADHAELVAAPARFRTRQTAQRQDEQDAGNEIEKRDQVWAHAALISSFSDTCRACAG